MLIPLNESSKHEFSLVGGKGNQLGQLIDLGLNVPDGFIISTKFYGKPWEQFAEELDALWDQHDFTLAAVRSSGNIEDSRKLSFAGLLHTELNVRKKDLEHAVKKIWHTANSYNLISYLERNDIDPNSLQIAVVVQKMIEADFSGVAFSINPVTEDRDQIVIESVAGSGSKLVSGEETPNTYYIDKETLTVTNSNIVEQIMDRSFKDPIKESLCQALLTVEKKWDLPVDLEWAVKNDKVYILQARPITTLFSSDTQELS